MLIKFYLTGNTTHFISAIIILCALTAAMKKKVSFLSLIACSYPNFLKKLIARYFVITLLFFLPLASFSQDTISKKLRVFVDCSNANCDMNYIKTEVNFVDYTVDHTASDVHILITQLSNGGGASQYQLIFFGYGKFSHLTDTLHYSTKPNGTDFENRDLLIKHLQFGLVPFMTKNGSLDKYMIQLKQSESENQAATSSTKDPWNYWVYRAGMNGNLNSDNVYKGFQYNGNLSATRITDKIKLTFNLNFGKTRNSFALQDSLGNETEVVVKNENYDFYHQVVKSISEHWSVGYDLDVSRSTFTNYSFRTVFKPAIEYDVFPYKSVNNKLFTIKYGIDVTDNNYIDTTVYNKMRETRIGQQLDVTLSLNQKWGTTNLSAGYHSYFGNMNLFNVSMGGGVNVRVTGGLSFNVFVFGSILRDQIYLPKGQATDQDILTRQRQLATNYTYTTFFGLSYRFGSKVNNFVNPRFNGTNMNFSF